MPGSGRFLALFSIAALLAGLWSLTARGGRWSSHVVGVNDSHNPHGAEGGSSTGGGGSGSGRFAAGREGLMQSDVSRVSALATRIRRPAPVVVFVEDEGAVPSSPPPAAPSAGGVVATEAVVRSSTSQLATPPSQSHQQTLVVPETVSHDALDDEQVRNAERKCPINRTVDSLDPAFDPRAFCSEFGLHPRHPVPRLFYGIMFSFELDMLEVMLHETHVAVDKYIIVESRMSHSRKPKPAFFDHVFHQSRFHPFLPKIVNDSYNARKALKSGWDHEKRQRRRVLQVVQASGIVDGDIFVGNCDLDEVFSRRSLLRLKYCHDRPSDLVFHSFGYRYNVNCYQDETLSQFRRSIYVWSNREAPAYDLYKARNAVVQLPIDRGNFRNEMRKYDSQLVWHMSTFGTFKQIRFKLSHSPHRFIDLIDNKTLAEEIEACTYNNRTRTKVVVYPEMLPVLMRRNVCYFQEMGWIKTYRSE